MLDTAKEFEGKDFYIVTNLGRRFYYDEPIFNEDGYGNPIDEIAHALSNVCRFGGHCREFYSVAEHSILTSYLVPNDMRFEALMHDATEAFMVDIPRPLKYKLPGYLEMEDKLALAIAKHFKLKYPWDQEIKIADNKMLRVEAETMLEERIIGRDDYDAIHEFWSGPAKFSEGLPGLTEVEAIVVKPKFLPPKEAKMAFIERYYALLHQRRSS